jgi:hypothetical protein
LHFAIFIIGIVICVYFHVVMDKLSCELRLTVLAKWFFLNSKHKLIVLNRWILLKSLSINTLAIIKTDSLFILILRIDRIQNIFLKWVIHKKIKLFAFFPAIKFEFSLFTKIVLWSLIINIFSQNHIYIIWLLILLIILTYVSTVILKFKFDWRKLVNESTWLEWKLLYGSVGDW